ncbi:VOC family protein [Streptomyces sp. NPDC093516]|uniref:VOC family protein n=1 Tax=Streptomyces sp. NPDC093516 TaxID=3155304 RepID=UPI003442B58E
MFTAITHSQIYVLDQDEALDFYVGKLGLEVAADADLGFMRWLTVSVPGHPERQILLERPGPPRLSEEIAQQVRDQEPTERPYGIDCGLRDPFGNSIRFTQPKG